MEKMEKVFLMVIWFFVFDALSQAKEISLMKERFRLWVGEKPEIDCLINLNYQKVLFQDARNKLKEARLGEAQYFLYTDLHKQIIFILFFDGQDKIFEIGKDLVSTGNPKRKGHFLTPTGIFQNSIENFGYRALGTKNKKGWRGLGKKGSRVWDFGWQKTERIFNGKKEEFLIRLLLHATDPDYGESQLGNPTSKGCIRISSRLNEFLDYYGILDKEYEENNHLNSVKGLLRKDRKPTVYQGKYLLIGDSSEW